MSDSRPSLSVSLLFFALPRYAMVMFWAQELRWQWLAGWYRSASWPLKLEHFLRLCQEHSTSWQIIPGIISNNHQQGNQHHHRSSINKTLVNKCHQDYKHFFKHTLLTSKTKIIILGTPTRDTIAKTSSDLADSVVLLVVVLGGCGWCL